MTNWGAHHLDITQWALGMDDSGSVEITGKGDFTGCIFEGEKSLLYVNRGVIRVWPEEVFDTPIKDSDVRLDQSTEHHRNWFECIKSRKLPICDVEVGHRSATVCHLGNIAIRTGRKIQWDPVQELIVGDPASAKLATKEYRAPWKLSPV